MRPNLLTETWRQGRAATNAWLSFGSAPVADVMAHQGWDSLTIDMQHGYADVPAVLAMLTAISTTNTVPLVRVPWNEPGTVMRVLDAGAYGVICPNIDTRTDCERFVGACRYAPLGYRSVGPRRAVLYAGADYIAKANETVLAIVQIESVTALGNVDEIAAVPGLDMLYVGPSDLALSMGVAPRADPTDPTVVAAMDRILAAAKRAKLRSGIYCRSADYAQAMAAKGFDLVTVTSDEGVLSAGSALAARFKAQTPYAAPSHRL